MNYYCSSEITAFGYFSMGLILFVPAFLHRFFGLYFLQRLEILFFFLISFFDHIIHAVH